MSTKFWKTLLSILAAAAAYFILISFWGYGSEASKLYASTLRQPMFTGFLTLGAFLLSMKVFMLANLKEKLIDSKEYQDTVVRQNIVGAPVDVYKPLLQLQWALTGAIVLSLGSSILQFSIGLVPNRWCHAAASIFAAMTFALVLWNVILLYRNIRTWLEYERAAFNDKIIKLAECERKRNDDDASQIA